MKNNLFYILLLVLISACSNDNRSYSPNFTDDVNKSVELVKEVKEVEEEIIVPDSELLTVIIENKLQEVYDLIDLITDKGLPLEMRIEAEIMLHDLVKYDVIYDSINEYEVDDVTLLNDSLPTYTVGYTIANKTKQADVYINISKAVVEGEVLASYEVTIEELD